MPLAGWRGGGCRPSNHIAGALFATTAACCNAQVDLKVIELRAILNTELDFFVRNIAANAHDHKVLNLKRLFASMGVIRISIH